MIEFLIFEVVVRKRDRKLSKSLHSGMIDYQPGQPGCLCPHLGQAGGTQMIFLAGKFEFYNLPLTADSGVLL